MKPLSGIINSSILSLESGEKVGRIRNAITDTLGQKVLAWVVDEASLLRPAHVLSLVDVAEYAEGLLIVQNDEAIIPPNEVSVLPGLVKNKAYIYKARVFDQNNHYLGRMSEALLDLDTGSIYSYYITRKAESFVASSQSVIKVKNCSIWIDKAPAPIGATTKLAANPRTL